MSNEINNQYLENISAEQLSPQLVKKLPLDFLKNQHAIPILLEGGQIAVALADPLDIETYDAITNILGEENCECVTCPVSEIDKAISLCYYQKAETSQMQLSSENGAQYNSVCTKAEDILNIRHKEPTVKLVNKIFFQAVQANASDIHLESYEEQGKVRFRVDGVLHDVTTLDKDQLPSLLSRLKVMANLNIAERRLPQDGQSRIKMAENLIDIRVSVIPTAAGERVVLRLLDKQKGKLGLEELGFSPNVLTKFKNVIGLSHGIILLTGPTGSGKTTTLYAAINELNNEERNILTVEDPIEYQISGVGQMQVKPKINLTFANCLRHILRQDPDVIMIGEIRDVETAKIAIQASLTGHLVFSTLHTNDSVSAITRLVDMGIEPYLISSSVAAVMAQRLVRVICPFCKTPYQSQREELLPLLAENGQLADADKQIYNGAGCKKCFKTGYLGRTGIFELFLLDDEIKEAISRNESTHTIKKTALKKGMNTLREDGLHKVLTGQTTSEEVYRITQDQLTETREVIESANC